MMADRFKTCAVDGCKGNAAKPGSGRGWCCKHYQRWKKHGDPLISLRGQKKYSEECSINGCGKPTASLGYCSMHYSRFKRNGDTSIALRDRLNPGEPCLVPDCEAPKRKGGYCQTHYDRIRRYGDPNGCRETGEMWLERHVSHEGDECLQWPFGRNRKGYAELKFRGVHMKAGRAICILVNGEPPEQGMHAAHSCGKGHEGCVNPKHLRWATPSQNEMDKVLHKTSNRGQRSAMSRLSVVDVLGVRALLKSWPVAKVAKEFGVSRGAVFGISTGKNWGWLDGEVSVFHPRRVGAQDRAPLGRSCKTGDE